MSFRNIVISKNAKLDYQLGYLVIRGEDMKKVHIDEITSLMIESTQVSMTAYLLVELVKNKVKVVFCDEKRNPNSELVSYYGSYDTSKKVREQVKWSNDIKVLVWTQIIREKIKNQALLLKCQNKIEANMLFDYIDEIVEGDITNREGHAAKVYFNSLFGKNFNRQDDTNSINSALNYGYAIILSCFTREIVANGYITQLALFHDNMFNPFNFASDLMEPFRPIVDRMVYEINIEKFEIEEKRKILKILEKQINIDGKNEYFQNAIKIYTKSILTALSTNNLDCIKFFSYDK